MLKLAVIGTQTLLGRELVEVLETRECSVLPLAAGPTTKQDEDGDLVVFAPEPYLLENLDIVILADTPQDSEILNNFKGRILDLRSDDIAVGDPLPLSGTWPKGTKRIKGRPALEQVLAIVSSLVDGITDLSGVHLCSIACLGDRGILGLAAQSRAVLEGVEPDETILGYRAAFEAIPQTPRGNLTEVRVPTFHGDILILNLKGKLTVKEAPNNVKWTDAPPTSREVAVTNLLLAHYAAGTTGQNATLTLGFDPILWGILQPIMRLLEL
jgi:aspartate-semialdehyde dehydrogenase